MNSDSHTPSLGEAASRFLVSLSPGGGGGRQQEVYKFARWYGWERPFAGLKAPEVANYADRLSSSDTDYIKKLELVQTFLVYAKKEGWSKSNLAPHLRPRKGKGSGRSLGGHGLPQTISLTRQGHVELKAKLVALKAMRSQAIDEIRKAAADKDFRENAPLEAAREHRGQLEGQIMELEEALKVAIIIDENQKKILKASIGATVVLSDSVSGEELRYMLVSPREADPAKNKISGVSPLGRAIIGRGQGEVVEVAAPAGKLRYQIKQVER